MVCSPFEHVCTTRRQVSEARAAPSLGECFDFVLGGHYDKGTSGFMSLSPSVLNLRSPTG